MENDNWVMCPLVDEMIENIDCIENSDIVERMIVADAMPEKFKQKKNWKEICRKCKWHNY